VNPSLSYDRSAIATGQNIISDDPYTQRGEYGTTEYLGDNIYRYVSAIGERNVFDGENWIPYNFDPSKIDFSGYTLEFYAQYSTSQRISTTIVDDIRWEVEYWAD